MEPADFLALCASDPIQAADHLDQAVKTLNEFADNLRASQSEGGGNRIPSGMVDRVRIDVYGSAGQLKQSIDTQEQ